jgi:hypothetical protein
LPRRISLRKRTAGSSKRASTTTLLAESTARFAVIVQFG